NEVLAAQLFVEIHAGRDGFGEPAGDGIFNGGGATATVRLQEDPSQAVDVFPGRLELHFPGHDVQLENLDPLLAFTATRVWYNGQDVPRRLMDLHVDVNAGAKMVQASITLFKPHWITADEIATIELI